MAAEKSRQQNTKAQSLFISPQQITYDIILLITGSVICAAAIKGILIPQNFVTGGVTGLAQIIHKLSPFAQRGLDLLSL